MPWLLLLHIAALICWCGSLLYLPALVVGMARRVTIGHEDVDFVARRVFTVFSTPAALVAIISGTAIFIVDRTAEVWLVAKLTLVSGLTICHVLTGRLTLSVEKASSRRRQIYCLALGTATFAFIVGILILVLRKPF
jgi:putative membrane protein